MSLALSCHGQESLPETTFIPLGQNSFRFDWKGEEGRTYFPQYSSNLVDWFYLPEIEQGPVHDPLDVTPLDGEGMPYPKLFMRLVKYSHPTLDPKNADFDGDGINNWQEITTFGTDPLKFISTGNGLPDGQDDSDLDGISDQWEQMLILQLGDPAITGIEDIGGLSDSDGDGVADYQEYQRGLNGYQTDSDGDGFSDRLSVDQSIYLKLNETAGSSASDASSEVRNGTLTGPPSWQAAGGIMEGALEFAGGTDGVDIPATAFDGLANLTVSLWFKTGSNAASQALLSAANSGQANELGIRLEQTTEAADTIQVDAGGGESFSWVRGSTLADDLWHHVVIVRNVANSQVTLYLDGAEVGTQSGTSFAPLDVEAATLARKHTGVLSFDSASAFVGNLDDLRVYSTSLESTHSLELFQPNDLDLDGLPDDWEIDQVENLSTLAAAADDLDGDGLTNRQEFENGTDPTDYFNGATPVVTLISGSGQTVYNGQRTTDPLVFLVSTDGNPANKLVNAPVELSHLELIGGVETLDGDTLATTLTLRSDSDGKVSVNFKAD